MTAVLAITLLLLQGAVPLAGRGTLTIKGTVTDSSAARIPGVVVSVKSDPGKLPRLAVTDESGQYSLSGLWPSKYEILVELPGFTKDLRNVDLAASVTIDFVMHVAQVNSFPGVSATPEPVLPQLNQATMTRRSAAMRLAAQLWQFSMQMEGLGLPRGMDSRRTQILDEFHALGSDSVAALNLALQDPDALMRRNAALVFLDLSGGFSRQRRERVDIREALPALIAALQDADSPVRAWSAQAIGTIGPQAAQAIPALIKLLSTGDEGDRNSSCLALGQIGPAARDALPLLRNALSDSSADVRRFAQNAINSIEMK